MYRFMFWVQKRIVRVGAIFLGGSLLSACVSSPVVVQSFPVPEAIGAMAQQGAIPFSVQSKEITGVHGEMVPVDLYIPLDKPTEVLIILTHGFMGTKGQMAGWGRLLSSHGMTVAVVETRNSRWFRGFHARNGSDLQAAADYLGHDKIIYGGFSSGGLAALLAAANDRRAVAYLGLDAVDTAGLGETAAESLTVQSLFLLSEPSSCNAKGNMISAIDRTQKAYAYRIRNATHCHFENPMSDACKDVCGSVLPETTSVAIAAVVRGVAAAWLLKTVNPDASVPEIVDIAPRFEQTFEVIK